jgi:putative endopeptidase
VNYISATLSHNLAVNRQPSTALQEPRGMNKSFAFAIVGIVLLGACSKPAAPPATTSEHAAAPAKPLIGAWGFDIVGMDPTVKPGDDFYRYANGKWLATEKIPADQVDWGTFTTLAVQTENQLHGILEALPADAQTGTPEQKARDYYRAYLDVAAIESVGMAAAEPGLKEIADAKSYADIARLMGRPGLSIAAPVNVGPTLDEKNPDRYIIGVSQGGLSLPDRDYYLKKDAQFVELRKKLVTHVEHILALAGDKDAAKSAKDILEIETQIAERHWPADKRRNRSLTYNLRTRDELTKMAGNYPWSELLAAGGLQNRKEFVVGELSAVESLAKYFTTVPVERWREYARYHYIVAFASTLPKAVDDEAFDFYDHILSGQPEQRDRWKRAVNATDGALGEVLGQVYVKKYFPPEAKQKMADLVENLRKAYAQRINNVPWMSAETKTVALEKLAAFHPKIGYPDKWRDYSKLEIRPGDAFGNEVRSRVFSWQFYVERLDKPTDRDEWFMSPQTVDAYYNPVFNEIVFPAAILQPPYFDPNADIAINYGGIGGVIGHEMSHGFDDQGAKSDAHGVLRTWWKPEDEKAFEKLVDALVAQYNQYEPLPGMHINGRLTAGENMGDLGGLTIAHAAYELALNGKTPEVLDGFTGEQRFFLSWAQVWRNLDRDEALRNRLLVNPHSPGKFRVEGVVRNIDDWYSAFDVKPEDKLYLAPDQRVRIW